MKALLDLFDRAILIRLAVIGFFIAVLEYIGIGAVFPFVALVSRASRGEIGAQEDALLKALNLGAPIQIAMFFGGIFFLAFIVKTVSAYLLYRLNARILMASYRKLMIRMTAKSLHADFHFFLTGHPTGVISPIQAQGTDTVVCLQSVAAITTETFLLILLLGFALWLQPLLTICLGVLLVVMSLGLKHFILTPMQELGEQRDTHRVAWAKLVMTGIRAIRDIKIMGLEDVFLEQASETIRHYSEVNTRHLTLQVAPKLLGEFCFVQFLVGFACVIIATGIDLTGNLASFAAFAVVLTRMVPSIHKIYNSASSFKYCRASMTAIQRTSALLGDGDRDSDIQPSVPFRSRIRLENLEYCYNPDRAAALADVSFTVERNTLVAIVGPSGSGKSTLLDILAGLLHPSSGAILFDDETVAPENRMALRSLAGYIPQQVTLLDGSFGFNIALTRDWRKHLDEVRQASATAQIDKFIASLPHGYETEVGEAGMQMSGGQRQRMGIARALFKNPSVMIFDEATAAVDGVTEKAILEAVSVMAKDRTVLFVTHRLQAIQHSDKIIVLEQGRLVGEGTHEELATTCSTYRGMLRSTEGGTVGRGAVSS